MTNTSTLNALRLGDFIVTASKADLEEITKPIAPGDAMADDHITRAEFSAERRATAAETDAKVARLEGAINMAVATLGGKLDSLGQRISADHEYNRTTRWVMVGIIVASAFAIGGLIVTMALYGDALFGRGMNVRDVVEAVVKEQQKLQQPIVPPVTQHPNNPK